MDIIAERSFTITNDPDKTVRAKIGRPVPDGDDFRCDYEIEWPSGIRSGHAMGIDSVQALMLALRHVGADINSSELARERRLVWFEHDRGLGFPLPDTE